MKSALICALFAAGISFCYGETVLKLEFPNKEFKPETEKMKRTGKIDIGAENMVEGPDGKFAFVLSSANVEKKQTPKFSARYFPYRAGSVELTFKVIKQLPKSKVRLAHVFSPAKNDGSLLIYYFFVNENNGFSSMIQCRKKQYKVNIPSHLIKKNIFNTVKVAWDRNKMTVFLNGNKYEDAVLPEEYAEEAAKPRSWSTFSLLPVIVADGDNWENCAAISAVKVEKTEE